MSTTNTRQAAWMAVGSVFSYSFTLISSMILSRYFNKDDYGTYQQVIYVYNTLLAAFTWGVPWACIFLPRGKNKEVREGLKALLACGDDEHCYGQFCRKKQEMNRDSLTCESFLSKN